VTKYDRKKKLESILFLDGVSKNKFLAIKEKLGIKNNIKNVKLYLGKRKRAVHILGYFNKRTSVYSSLKSSLNSESCSWLHRTKVEHISYAFTIVW
jgi:hypothetical protein